MPRAMPPSIRSFFGKTILNYWLRLSVRDYSLEMPGSKKEYPRSRVPNRFSLKLSEAVELRPHRSASPQKVSKVIAEYICFQRSEDYVLS